MLVLDMMEALSTRGSSESGPASRIYEINGFAYLINFYQ